jgi:hypothetical protein
MIYHSLSEIFDSIDETRARLNARLSSVGREQEDARPAPDAWSVKEIAEHLAITNERLLKLFTVMLMKAEAGGHERRAGAPFSPVSVEKVMERSRREKYIAPEDARPKGVSSLADSRARLERSHASIHALRPRMEAFDLTGLTFPHPVFGPLNGYQWLIFMASHEGRHLRQIENIIAGHDRRADGVRPGTDVVPQA